MARRTSTVAAEARVAARERRAAVLEERRRREEMVGALADDHAVALAMMNEVQRRADEEIAGHRRTADAAVAQLLELGERIEEVAELLGLSTGEVRAARRRVREFAVDGDAGPAEAGAPAAEVTAVPDAAPSKVASPRVPVGSAEGLSAA